MVLIAGLGNPGLRFRWNRHNVGFMLVDRFVLRAGCAFQPFGSRADICRLDFAGQPLLLARPRTYMNRSGTAVAELCAKYGLEPTQVLVVYDDVNLAFGTLRLRARGSAGGHNGMQSVIDALGSRDIPRLRIGIAPDSRPQNLSEYVLSNFEPDELNLLDEVLDRACQSVEIFLKEGIERAMSLHNRPPSESPL